MSVDERQLTTALATYAEGIVMGTSDVDRMQHDLHERIDRDRRPHRRRLVLAAAAVLLLVTVAAAGAFWLRRPASTVPATPVPSGSLTGLWKFANQDDTSFNTIFLIGPGGTIREYDGAQALVRHLPGETFHVASDGQYVSVDYTNAQGQPCRGRFPILKQSDGFVSQGPQTYEGPGCDTSTGPRATLTRLSPTSAATTDLPVVTEGVLAPVTDAVQLNGVWLLQGTGLVLAVDERTGPAEYVLDDDGDIDTAPDSQGRLMIQPEGVITLPSAGCDSTLQRAEVRYQGNDQTFTSTVASDPCNRFGGRGTLTWIRVLGP